LKQAGRHLRDLAMIYDHPQYRIMGDRSLLVEFGDHIGIDVHRKVRGLLVALNDDPLNGVIDTIPGYRSLLLIFDPLKTGMQTLQDQIENLLKTMDPSQLPQPRTVEIPVVYGGQYGPDLAWVADYHRITPEEAIRLHASRMYHVYMIGFMPGFPYMGELPKALVTPRRATPRTAVPQGSVALAQAQTGIYTARSPGGWQVIGRTPLRLFDVSKRPPALLQIGDRVRFRAIHEAEAGEWHT